MNTKIKLLGLSIIATLGVFAGANVVFAQNVVANCTSATLNGYVITNNATTNSWFEWSTIQSSVAGGSGTRTQTQTFSSNSNVSQLVSGLMASTVYYYRAVAENSGGRTNGDPVSFRTPACANTTPLPTVSITTDQTNITHNNSTTIRWNTNNATLCTSSGGNNGWSGSRSTSGGSFSTGSLANSTTYYISCSNSSGSANDSVTVSVGQQVNQPTVTISADQTNILFNGGTYLRWYTNNATSCTASGSANNWRGSQNSSSGSFYTGALTNTTTYHINCSNNSGSAQSSVTVSVGNQQVVQQTVGAAPSVASLLSTEITGSSAKLNGLVFTSSSQPSSAWFEWGVNTSFINKTQSFNVGAAPSVKHSDYITGLVLGQTYYYRVVAENIYGRTNGTTVSFVAEAAVVAERTIFVNTKAKVIRNTQTREIKNVTVVNSTASTQSLVILTIEGGADVIVSGEKRLYRVGWQNISGQLLQNVVLRVTLPASMFFESTSAGAFSAADNTVTIDIKSLNAGEKGDAFISAIAGRNITTGILVIVTANMVYTDTVGVQNDSVAYVTHHGAVFQGTQGANVFGAGSFLPTTLFEWIILLLLILVLILLGNHLYGRFSEEKHKHK